MGFQGVTEVRVPSDLRLQVDWSLIEGVRELGSKEVRFVLACELIVEFRKEVKDFCLHCLILRMSVVR